MSSSSNTNEDPAPSGGANDQPVAAGVPPDLPLKDIRTPHPHDVLCGRGGGTNNHIGNNHWRTLVAANKRLYIMVAKRQKMLVAMSIVRAVRSQNPPGRFLKRDETTGFWSDIGDLGAQEKTSQALREGAPDIRSEIERERQAVAHGGHPTQGAAAAAAAGIMPPMAAAYGQLPMPPMAFPYPGAMPGAPGGIPASMMYAGGMPPGMYPPPFVMPPVGASPYAPSMAYPGVPGMPPPGTLPPGPWPGAPQAPSLPPAVQPPLPPAPSKSETSSADSSKENKPNSTTKGQAEEAKNTTSPTQPDTDNDHHPETPVGTNPQENDTINNSNKSQENQEVGLRDVQSAANPSVMPSDRVIPVPTRVQSGASDEMPPPPPPVHIKGERHFSEDKKATNGNGPLREGGDLLAPRRIVFVGDFPVGFEGDELGANEGARADDLLADNFDGPENDDNHDSDCDWSNFKALVEAQSKYSSELASHLNREDPLRPLASTGQGGNLASRSAEGASGSEQTAGGNTSGTRETNLDRDTSGVSGISMMSFDVGGISRNVSRAGSTISLDIDPETVAALMRDVSNALSEMSISRGASLGASTLGGGNDHASTSDPNGSVGVGIEDEDRTDANRGGNNYTALNELSASMSASMFARSGSED